MTTASSGSSSGTSGGTAGISPSQHRWVSRAERERTMSMAVIGLAAGMALGFAGYFGGFGAFLVVALLGAVGFVAGKFFDGDLEPGDFFRSRDRDRDRDRDRRR